MGSKYSIETIFKAIDHFTAPLNKMTSSGKSFSKSLKTDFAKAQRSVDNFSKSFSNTMKNTVMIGAGLAIAGMGYAIKEGIQLASDLTEVQNVVDTSFGESADTINKWSQTAITQFGLSTLQAKKFNGTMGAMLKSSGISGNGLAKLSTDLVGLSGDFASFYNLDAEEAFMKIRSGISGETEPLKQLGINMSVANLEAFALTQGITKSFKKMTQSEQVMLRYNYLMKASKDAQGDFNKTLSTSWANQQRVLKTKFADKLATAMSKLLPMLIESAKYFNNLLDKIDAEKLAGNIAKGATAMFNFGKGLFAVLRFLMPLLPLIISVLAVWKTYQLIMIIAAAAQWVLNGAMSANPVGLIIIGIGILIGLIVLLVIHWKEISKWIVDTYEKFKIWVAIFFPPLFAVIELLKIIAQNWDAISSFATAAFDAMSNGVKGAIEWIQNLGKFIAIALIAPLQVFFSLLSKIPGMGDMTKGVSDEINKIQTGLISDVQSPISPAEKGAYTKNETVNRGEVTIKDTTGKAESKNMPKGNGYNIKLIKSGAF